MAVEKIRIAYSGEALQNGAMDVLDLAPALLAFAGLIQRANKVIGNDFGVSVTLNADDIHKGSFDFQLGIVSSIMQQVKLFGSTANESGLLALIEVLSGSVTFGKGLFWLIKKIQNRRITSAKESGADVALGIQGEAEPIVISKKLYAVLIDYEVRVQTERIMAPLKKQGINAFETRNAEDIEDKTPIVRIAEEEAVYFDTPPEGIEPIEDTVSTQAMILSIVGIVFDEEQKWRFTDGDTKFWAKIDDVDFWRRVESGELSFSKGDKLRCEITIRQHVEPDGKITVSRTINRVSEHIKIGKQIALDFDK